MDLEKRKLEVTLLRLQAQAGEIELRIFEKEEELTRLKQAHEIQLKAVADHQQKINQS